MSPSAAASEIEARRADPVGAGDVPASRGAPAFLSTATPEPVERRLAALAVALSALAFVAAAPFAREQLAAVPAFIPAYQAALVVGDFATAVLLFGQFSILRSRALLMLAGGYLFAAVLAIVHALTFPGLFAPSGLLGAGPQSTAWLYMFWHAGFPLAVIGYVLLRPGARTAVAPRVAIPGAIAVVLAAALGLAWLATAGAPTLPPIMDGNRYTPAMLGVVSAVWLLSLAGLVLLWLRRPRSVLDLWLMVVMCAWLFDIALSVVLNAGRFDLGFYAGRIYGLLAACFVLAVMLLETTRLYGRLATAADQLAVHAVMLEARVRERTRELERSAAEERRAHHEAVTSARRLAEVRSIHQRMVEASIDLVLAVDRRGNFIEASPSALPILGYQPDEMVGRSAKDFLHPDDLDSTRAEVRRTRHGGLIRHFDARYMHKEGRAVLLTWTGMWSEPDQRYFFTGRDMTERIAAEDQLRQAQKMEVVGQLTGGVAHDFNNLLGVVIGNLDLLEERVAEDPVSAELLEEALGAALRGADVTRQLLAFSRRQPLQPKVIAPNESVRGMARLLTRAIGAPVEVCLVLPDDAWPVLVDPAQLESALLNLAVNARDAMPEGGTLTIETMNCALDAEEAAAHVDGAAGDYLVVAVSDTGTGMPPEVVARVFEPFFSTKGVGKGTGLGLSMVYGFVKQSGGDARIYSEPGFGTTVRLYLPRAAGAVEDECAEAPVAPSLGGERVLVVEDNEALRRLSVRQFRELGYAVLEAGNGPEALAVFERGEAIDLLFTDIVMPGGLDGRALARAALALRPGLKVLFTSGFTAAAGAAVSAELADKLLSKPFRKPELARRVRAILDS